MDQNNHLRNNNARTAVTEGPGNALLIHFPDKVAHFGRSKGNEFGNGIVYQKHQLSFRVLTRLVRGLQQSLFFEINIIRLSVL